MTDYDRLRSWVEEARQCGHLEDVFPVLDEIVDALEAQQKAIDELERQAVYTPRVIGPGPFMDGMIGPAHYPGANYFVNERQPKTFDDIHQLNKEDDAARGNVPWGDQ